MLKKLLLMVVLPVGLAASPAALFFLNGLWSKTTAAISAFNSTKTATATPPARAAASSATRMNSATTSAAPAEKGTVALSPSVSSASPTAIPLAGLAEVLRFDVSLEWVMNRWPRVSAALAQIQLQGYRVPLVTGTAEDDLAGALTYYFNPRQEVQRITFHGTTGNARRLVELLATRYGFTRRLTNDASSFVYEALNPENKPKSVLWIRPAQVVKAEETYQRYQLVLVLERPEEPK